MKKMFRKGTAVRLAGVTLVLAMALVMLFAVTAFAADPDNIEVALKDYEFNWCSNRSDILRADGETRKLIRWIELINWDVRSDDYEEGRGGAFFQRPVSCKSDFAAGFYVEMSEYDSYYRSTGDGFTFFLSKEPGVLGKSGDNFGYAGAGVNNNSIGISYNCYHQVSFIYRENGISEPIVNIPLLRFQDYSKDQSPMKYYRVFCWVEYTAATKTLEIRMSPDANERPVEPTYSRQVDLAAILGDECYISVTAGKYYATQMMLLEGLFYKSRDNTPIDFNKGYGNGLRHTHNWVCVAGSAENELAAACDNTDNLCYHYDSNGGHTIEGLTLALTADEKGYTGIEGLSAFNEATGKTIAESDVLFYTVGTEGATSGGVNETSTPPTGPGYYYASLTVDGQTAVKAFTVPWKCYEGHGKIVWYVDNENVVEYGQNESYDWIECKAEGCGKGWFAYSIDDGVWSREDTCPHIVTENPIPHAHDGSSFNKKLTAGGALSAGSYYLDEDVTLTENITVSGTVNLCLNGHVLKGTGSGSVITVNSGATLNLYDCAAETEHKGTLSVNGYFWTWDGGADTGAAVIKGGIITGGYNTADNQGGGGVLVKGVFNMNGGSIAGNRAINRGHGGAVNIRGGSFTMNGGTIRYNTSDSQAGGVFVSNTSGSAFTMNGGTITGNYATNGGAGVYSNGSGTFIMNDGEISYNRSNGSQGGGGVRVENANRFTMNGGTIKNNTAAELGGGVRGSLIMNGGTITGNSSNNGGGVYGDGTITIGGTAVITGNTKADGTTVQNLYLTSGKVIDLDNLTTANVGISTQTAPGEAPVPFANASDTDYSANFTVDNSDYLIAYDSEGQLVLAIPTPAIKTASLTLGDVIGLNLYTYIPAAAKDGYMEITIAGRGGTTTQIPFSESLGKNDKGWYKFTVRTSSVQMADQITAVYHYGEKATEPMNFSIKEYLDTIRSGDYSYSMRALADTIADYGSYAQQLLSVTKGWTIGVDHAEMPAVDDLSDTRPDLSEFALVKVGTVEGMSLSSYSLNLDSETSIYLYFTPKDTAEHTFMVDGNVVEAAKASGGRYKVVIPNITALNLNRKYTVKVDGTEVVKVSALSYANAVLSPAAATQDYEKNVMAALYRYWYAATAYRNSLA